MTDSVSAGTDEVSWHTLAAADVAERLAVDPGRGLASTSAHRRRAEAGPNVLQREEGVPLWRRILDLLSEPMTVVLIIAAVISFAVSRDLKTPIVILIVVVFNAVVNLVQSHRAETSLKALEELTITKARVRRDAAITVVDADNLVPGDVVLLDAGDVVPADGRVIAATGLEVQESALTGESISTAKTVDPVGDPQAAVGDRHGMVFMSTAVTRGRGVAIVTATGMATEIGRVAGLLGGAKRDKTPLERQIGQLAKLLTIIAGTVVVVVFVLGLIRGERLAELFLTAVSLAVATIPEGLTAVVAFTLAMGASRLARRGAITKTLASVETLGATAHIGTDKTGTLTLNQMTARELFCEQRLFHITGEGYSSDGELRVTGEGPAPDVHAVLLVLALCTDAVIRDGDVIGDPTEGALVVLAEKGGVDVIRARQAWPRVAEVPFDSDRKYMATYHRWRDVVGSGNTNAPSWLNALAPQEARGARLMVKGAPDVLLDRSDRVDTPTGPVPLRDEMRNRIDQLNAEIGARGLRVMAIAQRDLDDGQLAEVLELSSVQALDAEIDQLTLLGFVGIVDPPRREVRTAIAQARGAGIRIHMITGDHVGTAAAIAGDLGIPGESISGSELDELSDDELDRRARSLGVLARVNPEHKIRMVNALRSDGSIVAMTGDGVNDAPALKQADIGIAMGITGTEVANGAASMILTDDNFATIVTAVREGRGIYDNVVKFVRFQIATSWGFVLIFLVAGVLGIAGGAPFTALQILWVNIIMDGPPAMALGLDRVEDDAMVRPPRPVHERILTPDRIGRILFSAMIMTIGTLLVLTFAPGPEPTPGTATGAGTLAFTTFVLFQIFNLLNVRSREGSVFSRHTVTNRVLWVAIVAVLALQIMVVHLPVLQGFFSTTALSATGWAVAVATASSVLWLEELRKVVARVSHRRAR